MMTKWRISEYWVAALCLLLAGVACGDENAVPEASPAAGAVQTIYRKGVPHTDRRGLPLMEYDAERSFFPIAMWGAPAPGTYGHEYDWQVLVDAGFNTVWPWATMTAPTVLERGQKLGLQLILMHAQNAETLEQIKDHPNLLGNVWMDEPIGRLNSGKMDQMFADFQAYREMADGIAPDMLVFINDAPWITPPATEWWIRWNTAGDVSCHDNYPIWPVTKSLNFGTGGSVPNSIPQSVPLAVQANQQRKPVWLIVGAFHQYGSPTARFPFRFPTPTQLRALVYSGIIHGATGIHYFIWDSYVSRDGSVIGMSPDPQMAYGPCPQTKGAPKPTPASPMLMAMSRALWDATSQINSELQELTPVILAPTAEAELEYSVELEGETVTDSPIRALLKPHPDGGYVLLTVNLDAAVVVATYHFDRDLKGVEAIFENREDPTVKCEGKSFVEDYEPFETHVYRIAFQGP